MKTRKNFIKVLLSFLVIVFPWIIAYYVLVWRDVSKPLLTERHVATSYMIDTVAKADHSKFEILKQDFKQPQEVTKACLSCHNNVDKEVMASSHWTWDRTTVTPTGDTIKLGKRNVINNFCIGVASNEPRCTSCHIGYGWRDNSFDFTKGENIDCLVCHDQTGSYTKFPTGAGYPAEEEKQMGGQTFSPPNYSYVAQNVGTSKKENCGACHFTGGGGNNVKHGDIANELKDVTRDVDVHMATDGKDMSCTACHTTSHHNITGQLYSVSSHDREHVECMQCHTSAPHQNEQLNLHSNKVSCQACHIPTYAKVNSTKMYWDWSTAGQFNPDGSQIVKKDSLGNIVYHTMKGSFKWERNVKPEYVWSNGEAQHYLFGDQVDTTQIIELNKLMGSYADAKAKIIPVKVHRGKQIYDPVNKILINPHLFGKDSAAYWKTYDWNAASVAGMKAINLPYSGSYSFVETEMYWPINHMVAKASEAVSCKECHATEGRLQNLKGFYLVGRDSSKLLDWTGILMIAFAFAGISIHAVIRIISKKHN